MTFSKIWLSLVLWAEGSICVHLHERNKTISLWNPQIPDTSNTTRSELCNAADFDLQAQSFHIHQNWSSCLTRWHLCRPLGGTATSVWVYLLHHSVRPCMQPRMHVWGVEITRLANQCAPCWRQTLCFTAEHRMQKQRRQTEEIILSASRWESYKVKARLTHLLLHI